VVGPLLKQGRGQPSIGIAAGINERTKSLAAGKILADKRASIIKASQVKGFAPAALVRVFVIEKAHSMGRKIELDAIMLEDVYTKNT